MRAWLLTKVLVAIAALIATPVLAAPKSSKGTAQEPKKDAKKETKGEKADPRVWVLARGEDTIVLRFGLPRAADPVFAVACQPGAQLIQFTVEVASGKVKAGDGVALSLAAGKRRLELAASAFRGAADGRVVVEAAVSLEGRVLDLFSEGETLVVKMPGASDSYPLAGAKAKLPDFRRACLIGR
ncbi:hypothetical protein EZH22_19510 [Xanthobacter dioxanivorans]|uniref:Uncharacterized protein n=1 Tax=Xanthobacter dioxanivorans TaxID=2528964 RepID=A0A974PLN2_9HYPH|nr:hypothetical protein [Xanthobacter dioxanivorans]QRG05270.1 hypothetical protein EZH22_19510 [Xanthobacter dioxanivorans]